MNRLLINLSLLFCVAVTTVQAKSDEPGFSLIRNAEKNSRIESQLAERREEITRRQAADSLLASIKVDSLTLGVYDRLADSFLWPRVYSGYSYSLNAPLYRIPEIKDVPMGVINATGDDFLLEYPAEPSGVLANPIPDWFKTGLRAKRIDRILEHRYMAMNPMGIDFAEWDLPVPPELPDEDYSFSAFLRSMKLPEITPEAVVLPETEPRRINWLHTFNVGLQLSQAYVSSNWYQGGNDYLSFLFNLGWNVDLNTVYHPNLLFQSSFQYNLGINTTPKGSLHKFSTSQDLLQYNLKAGFKAYRHWFYTLTLVFNTQLLNSYPDDSLQRTSSFLSPGTLNLGIGMTYSYENPKKTLQFSASLSPLSYNLKTCIAMDIDHAQFNIAQNKKTLSEIGSSAEVNLTWNFNSYISWKSRLFLFSNYKYFLADWENTFNFQINKFLSTQIFLHPRLDTSSEWNTSKWHHWMFKEILSFGISYTFTNKV